MANANKPTGFSPVKYLNGADWDGRGNVYYIDSTDTNAYYQGDPVKLAAGLDQKFGLQTITLGTAGATAVGILMGVGTNRWGPFINPQDLTQLSAPVTKSQSYFALIADDPMIVFEAQESGSGTLFTYTAASKNANFATATPASGNFLSAAYIDNGTVPATTSTYNLKLLGLSQRIDNAFGTYQKWYCLLNNHSYRTGVAGI
jgi:hypothetical protein